MSTGGPVDRSPRTGMLAERLGLVDAVDHLLNRGAVVVGEATISLGGVDLVYLGLNLLLSSVETLNKASAVRVEPLPAERAGRREARERRPAGSPSARELPSRFSPVTASPGQTGDVAAGTPTGEDPSRSLAQLVLTLVELLRQVLERQAIRRMEGGSLADDEVERMGAALLDLEARLAELRRIFDLSEADLNIDLGPLGNLL